MLITIGAFARLSGVSVRMLRHYDRIGLLVPARTDPMTGHRAYETGQLTRFNRIVALKGLGFTLDEVTGLLNDDRPLGELRSLLRRRQVELERRVHRDRHALERVAARLSLIEQEEHMTDKIQIKHVPAQHLVGLSATAPDPSRASVGPLVEPLFIRVAEALDRAGGDRTTPVARYRPGPGAAVQIVAGYVVPGNPPPGLDLQDLPAAEVAATLHQGPMQDVAGAYQTLTRWAETQGRGASLEAGRWREVYLEAAGEDQVEWIVEVQLELA